MLDELVERLVEFEKDYDPYGYRDDYDTDGEAREHVMAMLTDQPLVLVAYLLDVIDEMKE